MKIQRLNMDNSWHIDFAKTRLLVDPWLMGREVDYFSWFNAQWHKTTPLALADVPEYDVVLITQKYPDHFHQETLLELQAKHIICPASIEKELRKLLPHAKLETFNEGLKNVLGAELHIHHLPSSRKIDPIYDALIIENGKQSIFLATHGFPSIEQWKDTLDSLPPVHLLISPFDHYELPFFLGGTVAPGIAGLVALAKETNPFKIIATHDEDKHAEGLVSKFAKITKAPSSEKLQQYPELKDRILTLDHYKPHEL